MFLSRFTVVLGLSVAYVSFSRAIHSAPKLLEVEDYHHQVGGHESVNGVRGFRKYKDTLLKTVQDNEKGQNELGFYEYLNHSKEAPIADSVDKAIKSFVPPFYGMVKYKDPETLTIVTAIQLMDITHGYEIPTMIDIKMGRKTYNPNQPKDMVPQGKWKHREELGMGLQGMNVYNRSTGTIMKFTKELGRQANASEYMGIFRTFFSAINDTDIKLAVIESIQENLYEFRQLFQTQTKYRFFGSSLLWTYDVTNPLEKNGFYFIDFQRSFFGKDFGQIDQNVLDGIETTRKLLQNYKASVAASINNV